MNKNITKIIKEFSLQGKIRFKSHALIRIVERNIKIDEIEIALQRCQIIKSYPKDKPLPSYLLLGYPDNNRPLHIVVAIDEVEEYIWVITAYEPDKNKWNSSFTKRKIK